MTDVFSQKKIVHICMCGEYYEKYAYQDNLLPKYHRKLGLQVTIIATTYSQFDHNTGKVVQDFCKVKTLEDGTKVIRLRPLLPMSINRHIHWFKGLKRVLDNEAPDYLFIHGVESPNYIYISKYKRKHPNVQIAFDNHTDYGNSQHSIFSRIWAKYVIRDIIVKRILWTSEKFYGTTPERSVFLVQFYGIPQEKTDFLPLGADDENLDYERKESLRQEVREQFGVNKDDFLVVTGGKINRLKNIHTLVEAVIKVNNPKLKILVFGSIVEEMKDEFEKLKSDRFIYAGWVPSDDVYRYFYAADLVAFPGLHSVLWEQAVAARVPTAFTKLKGFDHVNFNDNCILLEEKTCDYYQKVIRNLLHSPDRYEQLKKNASSKGACQFLYSEIASKVIEDLNS